MIAFICCFFGFCHFMDGRIGTAILLCYLAFQFPN